MKKSLLGLCGLALLALLAQSCGSAEASTFDVTYYYLPG